MPQLERPHDSQYQSQPHNDKLFLKFNYLSAMSCLRLIYHRLGCIGLCQGVITKTSQTMSYLHSKCHN